MINEKVLSFNFQFKEYSSIIFYSLYYFFKVIEKKTYFFSNSKIIKINLNPLNFVIKMQIYNHGLLYISIVQLQYFFL
jgi:hypothetical protein